MSGGTKPNEGTIFEPFDVEAKEGYLIVVIADPDVEKSPVLSGQRPDFAAMRKLSAAAFDELGGQLGDEFSAYPLEVEGFLSFVIGTDLAEEDLLGHQALWQPLRHGLLSALDGIESRLGLCLKLSVSSVHPNTGNVYDGYNEAFSIAEHFPFLDMDKRLITIDDILGEQGASPAHRAELEKLWFDYTVSGSFQSAGETLKRIVEENAGFAKAAISLKPELESRLSYTVYMLRGSVGFSRATVENLLKIVDGLRAKKDLRGVLELISVFYAALAQVVNANKGSVQWADRISQYVRSNYSNPDLNGKMIASRFGLNPAYISSLFHKSTGIKLVDFIHSVRLEHVRQLLLNTSLSMTEIAKRTGYYDRYAMSRVFVRYVGVPPSQYRRR